jgi:histidyl-tRNA synthetase
VAIVGDSEIEVGKVMLKNMLSGEQQLLTVEEVIALILG